MLTYGITAAAGQSAETTFTLSVFIGGVVLVVQYLAEFDERLVGFKRDLADLAEEQRARLADVNRATRFYQELVDSPVAVPDLEQLIKNLATIENLGSEMISGLAMAEFGRLRGFVEQLRAGEASYDGEDREWLLALTKTAQGEIVATSSALVDDDFWDGQLGADYLRLQAEAIKRGIAVRRLFLADSETVIDGEVFQKRMQRQREVGIQVLALPKQNLDDRQLKNFKDFALFDKRLYYQVEPPSQLAYLGEASVVETRLSTKPQEALQGAAYFEELWDIATERHETQGSSE